MCNEPREPQGAWYLGLELAQLGDNPRSVRVGSPSDCGFGFGWKTEGNQAEFLASMQQLISKVAVGNSPSANNYNT